MASVPGPADLEGLPDAARAALDRILRIHGERGDDFRVADLPSDFLYELAKDPPSSEPARLGAAVAVRALRASAYGTKPLRWPRRVDPGDPAIRRESYRLAAIAIVALTSRTKVGISGEDPDLREVLKVRPGDDDLVDGFMASEREILRRKRDPVDYPAEEFLRDLREVPDRLLRPGRILPQETEPTVAGPYRFTPNHDDRVVRLYDFFRDKYGSPRGERRADLYLAVLGYISRHRAGLEAAGEIRPADDGKFTFREGFLEDLVTRPPGWFEGA